MQATRQIAYGNMTFSELHATDVKTQRRASGSRIES